MIKVLDKIFEFFGPPRILQADNGPSFRKCFNEWLESRGILRQTSSAYNSQSNGLCERAVGRCKDILKKCNVNKEDWRAAMSEMRLTPSHALGGACPAQVFHRRMPRRMLPTMVDNTDYQKSMAYRAIYLEKMAADIKAGCRRRCEDREPHLWIMEQDWSC